MQPHIAKQPNNRTVPGYVWALLLMLIVMIAETVVFRNAYLAGAAADAGSVTDLNEAQKKLIDTQAAYSTWLQTLAIGALAALLGLRLKDWADNRLAATAPMVACGLLACSIYSAHLVQSSIIYTLAHGPIKLLYGGRMSVPLEAQFWTLLAGFGVLATWLFGRKTAVTGMMIVLSCITARAASTGDEWSQCIQNWHQSRGLTPPAALANETAIISALAKKTKRIPPKAAQCSFAFQVMDELRYRSFAAGGAGTSADVAMFADSMAPSLDNPNLSTTDALQLMIKIFQPWNPSSGLLELTSKKSGRRIAIDGRDAGYQSYTARLPTGWHKFELIDSGARTLCREFYFKDGDRLAINLDFPDNDYSATRPCGSSNSHQ